MICLYTLLVNISESVFANCYHTCFWLIMHYMCIRVAHKTVYIATNETFQRNTKLLFLCANMQVYKIKC